MRAISLLAAAFAVLAVSLLTAPTTFEPPGAPTSTEVSTSGHRDIDRERADDPDLRSGVSAHRQRDPTRSGRPGGTATGGRSGHPGADGEEPEAISSMADAEVLDPGPAAGVEPMILSDEGFQVVPGTAVGGRGPLVTYTVEVEPSASADPLSVAAAVEAALYDPRSWAADVRLRRIDRPEEADIRVLLATPVTVDGLCAEVGLATAGRFSCWNGTFAALNANRWEHGADDFTDLSVYRRYLVNHEVGHGLGHGHEDCPGPGEPAPVMMQQTKGTDGCEANGWVYPERSPA